MPDIISAVAPTFRGVSYSREVTFEFHTHKEIISQFACTDRLVLEKVSFAWSGGWGGGGGYTPCES